jgi:hypothetical protein
MQAARAVLASLDRIERLERSGAPPRVVLDAVRELLVEAEAWARAEPDGADLACDALVRLRDAIQAADLHAGTRAGLW